MNEDRQAGLLAEWLEGPPGVAPPEDIDGDVLEAIYAMRPEMAPAPRVTLDDILAGIAKPADSAWPAFGGGLTPVPLEHVGEGDFEDEVTEFLSSPRLAPLSPLGASGDDFEDEKTEMISRAPLGDEPPTEQVRRSPSRGFGRDVSSEDDETITGQVIPFMGGEGFPAIDGATDLVRGADGLPAFGGAREGAEVVDLSSRRRRKRVMWGSGASALAAAMLVYIVGVPTGDLPGVSRSAGGSSAMTASQSEGAAAPAEEQRAAREIAAHKSDDAAGKSSGDAPAKDLAQARNRGASLTKESASSTPELEEAEPSPPAAMAPKPAKAVAAAPYPTETGARAGRTNATMGGQESAPLDAVADLGDDVLDRAESAQAAVEVVALEEAFDDDEDVDAVGGAPASKRGERRRDVSSADEAPEKKEAGPSAVEVDALRATARPADYSATWYLSHHTEAGTVERINAALQEASTSARNEDFASAASACEPLIMDEDIRVAQDFAFRAASYALEGRDGARALAILQRGVQRGSANTPYLAMLRYLEGRILENMGQPEGAARAYRAATTLNEARK
jgi:hypothetical protein